LAAGVSPQTPLGSLQRSPRPSSWIKGRVKEGTEGEGNKRSRREGEREERRGRGGRGRKKRRGGTDFGPSQCWKQIDATDLHVYLNKSSEVTIPTNLLTGHTVTRNYPFVPPIGVTNTSTDD